MSGRTAMRGAAVMSRPATLGGRAMSSETYRLAAMRRDHAQARERTRWTMAASVVLHASLIVLLAFIHEHAPSATPITEITVLDPEDLAPPPPVAVATTPPATTPPAVTKAPSIPTGTTSEKPSAPPAAPRRPRSPANAPAATPAVAAAPRPSERGRARAREVASAVRAGDMLKGIDAMVGVAGRNATGSKTGSANRTALAQSEARAAAVRAGALAGAAGGETGRDALERTTRGAGGHAESAPLARDQVVIGELEAIGSGGRGEAGGGGDGGGQPGNSARTTESLMAVVHRYAGGIKYCYDQVLRARPETHGRLVLLITVAPIGTVTRVQIAGKTIQDPELETCVLGQVKAWKFPPSPASPPVSFRCPLVFTPPAG